MKCECCKVLDRPDNWTEFYSNGHGPLIITNYCDICRNNPCGIQYPGKPRCGNPNVALLYAMQQALDSPVKAT